MAALERQPRGWVSRTRIALVIGVCVTFVTSRLGEAGLPPQSWSLRVGPGVSLPGPYYSKAYLQEFPLLPHQRVVTVRLRPYQHYGRHAPGVAFPGLTDGAVHADVFPYRYLADFVPPAAVAPPLIDECPHERKWPPPPARP